MTEEREEVIVDPPATAPVVVAPPKMSWGAIFGGAVAALSIWLMLYALGLAFGLSPLDPNQPDLKSSGIFTGIWSLVVPLVALFVGGFVAGRGAGAIARSGGALHGLVVWGLTTIGGAWLVFNLTTSVLGGALSLGRGAADLGKNMPQTFGLDANDAVGPINDRLRAEGKPEVTPQQLQNATRDVTWDAMRTGRVDHEALVRSIDQNTPLDRADSEDVANRIQSQLDRTRGDVESGAIQAAKTTGKVMFGVFGALVLGLIASILGGIAGVSRVQRVHASRLRERLA